MGQRVHEALINTHLAEQLIGHISRDSTAISAREKPIKKSTGDSKKPVPKKLGRPKKGEERVKEPTRMERQAGGMSWSEMEADLPTDCTVEPNATAKDTRQVGSAISFISMHPTAASR